MSELRIFIENRTFAEIEVGESVSLARTLSRQDIELFAVMSGDVNPAHLVVAPVSCLSHAASTLPV